MKKQTRQIVTKKQSSFFSRSVFERHVMHKVKLVFFFQDPCVFVLAQLEQENDGTLFSWLHKTFDDYCTFKLNGGI